MTTLSIDFETRSTIDLRSVGVYRYVADTSTDMWCAAFAFDDEEPLLWVPGDSVPERIAAHDGEIRAWNAQFERLVWTFIWGPRYGFPVPRRERFVCTAAEAAAMGLPRNLKDAARVLRVGQQKESVRDEGHNLVLRMARPRSRKGGKVTWWEDAERKQRLFHYCMQDVRTERAVAGKLRRLSDYERRVYLLDQKVNDRGVLVDVPLVNAMSKVQDTAMDHANSELARITGGAVAGVTKVADFTRWLQSRGVQTESVAKAVVRDMLGMEQASDVQAALELRMEAGRSSLAKLKRIPDLVNRDGRVRGLLLYHGASTGRWSGKLLQPQNFPRGEVADVEQYIPAILAGDLGAIDAPLLVVLSSLLRGTLIAQRGARFLSGDFSQIEARIVAWIAEQDDLVAAFGQGRKIYEEMATKIYGVALEEVTKTQRQIAKNTVLGCGFQMGAKRFRGQVKEQAGIDIEPADSQHAVDTYREVNSSIVDFWYAIDRAARAAIVRPDVPVSVGRRGMIRFLHHGRVLWCVLPSGRPLAYFDPRIEADEEGRSNVVVSGRDALTRQWRRIRMYGGFWTENVVQAMARDVMAAGMLALEEAGYPIVLTVHDEVVAEVPDGHGTLDEFLDILKRGPAWAHDLPTAVEGWEGGRYRK